MHGYVGHPFTEYPDVVILIVSTKDDLRIMNSMNDLNKVAPNRKIKTALWAREPDVIPSNFLGHIVAMSNLLNQELCIEGGLRENGQLIPRCVVSTNKSGETVGPIFNITGEEVFFKPGEKLTRGEIIVGHTAQREVNTEPILASEIDSDMEGEDAEKLLKIVNDYKGLIA